MEKITGEYVLKEIAKRNVKQSDVAKALGTSRAVIWYQLHHGEILYPWNTVLKSYLRRLSNKDCKKILTE